MSARKVDINDFIIIEGNPISKVGVFEYSGKQIDDSLSPDTIYKVYRPEEELSSPECIESFKLLPWINDHVMLGKTSDGATPAEQKGVQGVIGENVFFEEGYLKGNLKIFSQSMTRVIAEGKEELSIGYRCKYEPEKGNYDGEEYEFVQREIRGNHLALVDEGRSGPDVSVLDHFKFTFDTKELGMQENEKKVGDEEITLGTIGEKLDKLIEVIAAARVKDEDKGDVSDEDEEKKTEDEDAEASDEDEEKKAEDEDEEKKTEDEDTAMDSKVRRGSKKTLDASLKREIKKIAMDAAVNVAVKTLMAQIGQRDTLASNLSKVVGAFDHSKMTMDEVAKYGVKRLKEMKLLNGAPAGQESAVLAGYLEGRQQNSKGVMVGVGQTASFDSAGVSNQETLKNILGRK